MSEKLTRESVEALRKWAVRYGESNEFADPYDAIAALCSDWLARHSEPRAIGYMTAIMYGFVASAATTGQYLPRHPLAPRLRSGGSR